MTSVYLAALPVDLVMDPTPCSFRGIDPYKVEDIEIRNQVEDRVDN